MLASLTLLALGIFGPGIATGLVSGGPQLGAGAMAGAALGAAGAAVAVGAAATASVAPSQPAHAWPRLRPSWPAAVLARWHRPPAVPSRHIRPARLRRAAYRGRRRRRGQCRQDRRASRRAEGCRWRTLDEGACRCRLPARCAAASGGRRAQPIPQRLPLPNSPLGQTPAPQAATHPRRDHRRPHAARWRWRQLQPRPEPARFRFIRRRTMRFKRPQRHADTPQPATPYQAAGQVWTSASSPRVQAKNWRLMAFGCLALALLMAGGLVWRSGAVHRHALCDRGRSGWAGAYRGQKPPRRTGSAMPRWLPPGPLHRPGAFAVHRPHRGAAELARCLQLTTDKGAVVPTTTPA